LQRLFRAQDDKAESLPEGRTSEGRTCKVRSPSPEVQSLSLKALVKRDLLHDLVELVPGLDLLLLQISDFLG
jgi:hypothetical protein